MMDITREIDRLRNNQLLRNENEVVEFQQAINNIMSNIDLNNIVYLSVGFHDLTEHDEIMFGLIHAIESYDSVFGAKRCLKKFVEAIPVMQPHANEWLKTFHKRILNDEQAMTIYANVVKDLETPLKENIVDIINKIKEYNVEKFGVSWDKFKSLMENS